MPSAKDFFEQVEPEPLTCGICKKEIVLVPVGGATEERREYKFAGCDCGVAFRPPLGQFGFFGFDGGPLQLYRKRR